MQDGKWEHQAIVLKSRSYDDGYEDIVMTDDTISTFRVIGFFLAGLV